MLISFVLSSIYNLFLGFIFLYIDIPSFRTFEEYRIIDLFPSFWSFLGEGIIYSIREAIKLASMSAKKPKSIHKLPKKRINLLPIR